MRPAITIILLTMSFMIFGQSNEDKVITITTYTASIDSMINISDGLPGEILSSTVTSKRNIRAIGMQETKITFYYTQKDDSVYDDGKSVHYIQRNNPPLKVLVQYNIATSQSVNVSYYFDKELNYYKYVSSGEYGYDEQRFWFDNSNPIKYEKYDTANAKPAIERNDKFSKTEYSNALLILDHAREYKKLYEVIFTVEKIDK
jgi:hypothetical protein